MIIIGVIAIFLIVIALIACSFYYGLSLGLKSVRLDGEVPVFTHPKLFTKKLKSKISAPNIEKIEAAQKDSKLKDLEIPSIVRRRDDF